MDRIPKHADGHSLLSLSAPHSFPSGAGRSLRSLGYAHARAAQSRRPGRFAARSTSPCPLQTRSFPSTAGAPDLRFGSSPPVPSPPSRAGEGERRRHRLRSPSAFQRRGEQGELGRSGVGHEEGRTAGPEHATACRAAWRVGKRAERAPAVEGNERREMRAGYRRYGPPSASRRGPSLTQRTVADAGACSATVSSIVHNWIERIVSYLSFKRTSRALVAGSGACSGLIPVHEASVVGA